MPKSFAVGDTVWALWPGSKRYYEATVIDVSKNTVQVDFKDGYKTEVPLRNTYVRLILKLLAYCCPCRLLSYERIEGNHRKLSRSLSLSCDRSRLGRHFVSIVVVDVTSYMYKSYFQ